MMEQFDAITTRAQENQRAKHALLVSLGWQFARVANTHLWMWQKKLDDHTVIIMRADDAFYVEHDLAQLAARTIVEK